MKWITSLPAVIGMLLIQGCRESSPVSHSKSSDKPSMEMLVRQQQAWHQIDSLEALVQTGDIITRTGNDFTSESLRNLQQRNKLYSHCGIASRENDSVFVYHALGGEFNPDQLIRREPFSTFGAPSGNRGIGIFRFQIPVTLRNKCAEAAKNFLQQGIRFDMDFNLASNDKMYCAEMVMKAMIAGSERQLHFDTSRMGKFVFVGVDDLILEPHAKAIAGVKYP